jgi:hypothetical protein
MNKKLYLILLAILFSKILILAMLKFTAWPEMLLWPYLMIKGWLPYSDIAIAHTPLMLLDLSIFYKIFGVGIIQLKIFTWLLILLFDLLIFVVVKRIWNKKTALFSVLFYSFWMIFYEGNGLWFDLYMGVIAFCSFYFALKKDWFWVGVFWALAFLSKQTAFWFLIPIFYSIIVRPPLMVRSLKGGIFKFVGGLVVVFSLFFVLVYALGILPDFWSWAIKFGIFVLPKSQGQMQFPALRNVLAAIFPFLIFLPLFLSWPGRGAAQKSRVLNLFLWAFAGFLGAFPRFEFFHFQPAIPYLAIVTSLLISNLNFRSFFVRLFLAFYFLASFYLVLSFCLKNYGKGTRFYEKEVLELVSYVKKSTIPGEKILVLNWWDSIYPLSGTLPATRPWVPQLPWYQNLPGIEEKEIGDLKEEKPNLILLYPYTDSGLSSYVPQKLYGYVRENYDLKNKIGNIEVLKRK